MVAKFTKDVIEQKLPSGQPFTSAAGIPPSFFTSFMTTNIAGLQNVKTVPGAQNELMPRARLMHTLGTKKYRDNFLLLQSNLNNMKEGVSGISSSPPQCLHLKALSLNSSRCSRGIILSRQTR
jgi:hypothetical protein